MTHSYNVVENSTSVWYTIECISLYNAFFLTYNLVIRKGSKVNNYFDEILPDFFKQ